MVRKSAQAKLGRLAKLRKRALANKKRFFKEQKAIYKAVRKIKF